MLTLHIQGGEYWDSDLERFVYPDSAVLRLEHSLVSLSNWESRFHKLFLTPEKKTDEEMMGYVESMVFDTNVDLDILQRMSEENAAEIDKYINNPMTATTVAEPSSRGRAGERISSELIYYWMSQYQINIACENWHLNRLFTLIKIHHAKSEKPKPMSKSSRAQQMAELNAKRKAQSGTTG